ncbi:MAG: EamA family transporter [Nanoarchaeota archaeon]
MATNILSIIAVIFASLMGGYASILMKKASASFGISIRKLIRNYPLIIAVALYGISTLIYIPALKYGELSVLYPLVAMTYIWTSLFSVRLLGEKMNNWKWMGIGFILLGVASIGAGS